MSKLATLALAAVLSAATVVPAAQADPGRHYRGNHQAYNGGHHRGRGHWHNGKWIALGILGAAVGAAIADFRISRLLLPARPTLLQ